MWNLATGIVMGLAATMYAPPMIFVDPRSMTVHEYDELLQDLLHMRPGSIIRVPQDAYVRWMPVGNPFQLPKIVNMVTGEDLPLLRRE